MDNIIPKNEYTEIESRLYADPQVALDRSRGFIDNLRATQAQRNEQIARDTYNLGSELPSVQGGLGTNTAGNMGYFTSRLQTPQTASAVANLRATAQAAALNQALENEQAIWKKRYQDAYRAYQKRQNDKTNTPQNPDDGGEDEDAPEFTDSSKTIEGTVPSVIGGYTLGIFDTDTGKQLGVKGVPYGEEYQTEYDYYFDDADSTPTRRKMAKAVAGNNTTYLHTLPNGNIVKVDESKYSLEQKDGGYVLRNKTTGEEFPVGG